MRHHRHRRPGRVLDTEREARDRHPRLRARVLGRVALVVRHGQDRVRQDHRLLRPAERARRARRPEGGPPSPRSQHRAGAGARRAARLRVHRDERARQSQRRQGLRALSRRNREEVPAPGRAAAAGQSLHTHVKWAASEPALLAPPSSCALPTPTSFLRSLCSALLCSRCSHQTRSPPVFAHGPFTPVCRRRAYTSCHWPLPPNFFLSVLCVASSRRVFCGSSCPSCCIPPTHYYLLDCACLRLSDRTTVLSRRFTSRQHGHGSHC